MKKLAIIFVLLTIYIGYQFKDTFDPESIKGKNVIITGASTGIGEQLAYHYARLGANVVITARREQRLKEVIEKCKQEGTKDNRYEYFTLDLGQEDASQRLVEFAEEKLGGIDILVLNHKKVSSLGRWLGAPNNFTHLSQTININFYGYVKAATYALSALEKSKGSIIVLSSVTGKVPNPFMASYAASKHAIEGFFGSLREEFIMASKDISITLCTLGFIETENAVEGVKAFGGERLLNSVTAVDASDTALAVIQAGASRVQRIYYPYGGARLVIALYCFFPETISSGFRYLWELKQ